MLCAFTVTYLLCKMMIFFFFWPNNFSPSNINLQNICYTNVGQIHHLCIWEILRIRIWRKLIQECYMLQRVVPTMWCKNNGLFIKKKILMWMKRNNHMMAAEYMAKGTTWYPFSWPTRRILGERDYYLQPLFIGSVLNLLSVKKEQHQEQSCNYKWITEKVHQVLLSSSPRM